MTFESPRNSQILDASKLQKTPETRNIDLHTDPSPILQNTSARDGGI
jgi:hypothetical protein